MAEIYSTKKIMYEKMKHYCAYQERCQKEVEEKLRELKVAISDIDGNNK